jgi:predicted unusual protein kinase regulating ubiquinone biosynthesis (AarF/ABC1/UbiB family)
LSMPFIHFDPHPGNILITDDNCIVLVDYGMAGEISDRMRRGFSDSIEALIDRDARKLIDVLNDLGFIRRNVHRYSLLPIADFFINEILDTFKLERESFYNIDLSPIRDEIVEIIYTQPFTIPIDWAYIGKTLSTVAGLISQLNPDFNLYGELKRHTRRILSAGVADRAVRAYNSIKANVSTAAAMPMRISEFMDDLERGYFKIKVDYGEMIDKIDEVKGFVIRVIAFILALVAGVSAYVFFNEQRIYEFLMFLVLGAAALLFFLLYRRRFRRDKIRDFFNE